MPTMRVHWILETLILFSVYIESGTSVHEASQLILTVLRVLDKSVLLRWEGMDLNSVTDCEINFSSNHTELWTIMDYTPTNFSFSVPDLQTATFYKFVLVCHDNTNGKHTSQPVNFTTAFEGSTVAYSNEIATPILTTKTPIDDIQTTSMVASTTPEVTRRKPFLDTSSSTTATSHSSTVSPTTKPSTTTTSRHMSTAVTFKVTTKHTATTSTLEGGAVLETETSPMDIGLGIAFGFIGCGVFAMMAYFCIKEYRRRMRIRRFLQYRQQENEPFPDMDNDDDEGIVL